MNPFRTEIGQILPPWGREFLDETVFQVTPTLGTMSNCVCIHVCVCECTCEIMLVRLQLPCGLECGCEMIWE